MGLNRRRAGRRIRGSSSMVAGAKDPRWNRNARVVAGALDEDGTFVRDPNTGQHKLDPSALPDAPPPPRSANVPALVDQSGGTPKGNTVTSIREPSALSLAELQGLSDDVRDAIATLTAKMNDLLEKQKAAGQMDR